MGTFILGCLICALIAALLIALPTLRDKFFKKDSGEHSTAVTVFYYVVYVVLHALVMLLVMEMNGFLSIAVILGVSLGYYYSLTQKK